jgi:mono/diheme cytochrome c family protein
VTLVAIATGVYLVSRLGLYPIGADNPPSQLERMLAARAMDVYADKHKPDVNNPVAATPDNLIEGAKEYEEHCAVCHGGAQARISPLNNKFSPPVPQLINRVPHDPEPWLFWVTKHGVRMTGMPAWDGILTDDEIWKTVAFIKQSGSLPAEVESAWRAASETPPR